MTCYSLIVERVTDDIEKIKSLHISFSVYLFLGNKYALIDFVRCMHDEMGVLKAGEHVIISVKDQPFNPENPEELKRHFVKSKSLNDV